MSVLGDYKICAARDAEPFLLMIRSKKDGSGCAREGYVPCNPKAEPENIVCVKENSLDSCPITDLGLFKSLSELHDFLVQNEEYEYEVADNDELLSQGISLS